MGRPVEDENFAVDHRLCDGWKQKKPQILIAHQKEEIDRTQKSPASRQKKFLIV